MDAVFSRGIRGVVVERGDQRPLSKAIVKKMLGELLDVPEWDEVIGPDTLAMK